MGMTLPTRWLVQKIVKGRDPRDPATRADCGRRSGRIGICLNLLLAAVKFLAGTLSGSLAMMGDALNNLTDAVSSIVTLIGFRVAGHKADKEHPFGHGRAEYVSGFVVSLLILLVAFELGRSSVERLFHPAAVSLSTLAAALLCGSILVKAWMWRFNTLLGRSLDSEALRATAEDSLSDCAATLTVLVGAALSAFGWFRLDALAGLGVAAFIAWTGIKAARETLDPLLGRPASEELTAELSQVVLEQPEIMGIHELVVHEYGPGNLFATIHAEVSADMTLLAAHAAADRAEQALWERLGVQAVIHVDPVEPQG